MWLGVHAPERLRKLVICNTSAHIGLPDVWDKRIERVYQGGTQAIKGAIEERWFSSGFRARSPESVARTLRMLENTPVQGYIGCCETIRDADLGAGIQCIRVATLVIGGQQDPVTTVEDAKFLASQIAGAQLVELDTSHLSNVEDPAGFAALRTALRAE